jgi:hypothetical protein
MKNKSEERKEALASQSYAISINLVFLPLADSEDGGSNF